MKLNQLAHLVALDHHRHFGRAAAACHVTQPALSMQIQKLERELGVELFDRSRTPPEPTEVGRRVIAQARDVLDGVARVREAARGDTGEIVGELVLGVIPTIGPYLLPPLLPRLARRYPRLDVRIEELQTTLILERVQQGDLDAGLIATAPAVAGLAETPLFEEPFTAYVGDDHRLAGAERLHLSELQDEELWLLTEGHCLRDQVAELCGSTTAGRVRFESGNLETLKRLVEHAGGITLLPGMAAADLHPEEQRRVRHFAEPVPRRTVRLVQRRAFLKRRLIAAVVAEIRPPSLRKTAGARDSREAAP